MSQGYLCVDVNLMVGNVTRDKNGTMTSVSMSVKPINHLGLWIMKRIMPRIPLHMLASVIRIVRLVNS